MTETQLRRKVVDIANGWLGVKEGSSGHKKILEIYNSHSPLPRGVKMLDSYAWCAATVSAAFIKAGLTDIGFVECSCGKMIELYKKAGRWMEADNYSDVKIGDLIMYDWDDTGSGENTGAPEHVGLVVGVSGSSFKVIEGNYNNAVGYRNMKVNGRYIRGFCLPDYAGKAASDSPNTATSSTAKKPATPIKVDYAKEGPYKPWAKEWTVTAKSGLRLRRGAGESKGIIRTMPTGEVVTCYGFYTKVLDTIWLLVKDKNGQTGFCSKTYLK